VEGERSEESGAGTVDHVARDSTLGAAAEIDRGDRRRRPDPPVETGVGLKRLADAVHRVMVGQRSAKPPVPSGQAPGAGSSTFTSRAS
jgi:hypothetical protein